ncbi:MAG: hypothetical protein ABSH50_25885 [Bryobacteraceae bacterium]|jgi:hypothetical protein
MSIERKAIVWIGVLGLLTTGLCPPWIVVSPGVKAAAGYHLLFAPPADESLEVDALRLVVEWILIATVAVALIWSPPSRPMWVLIWSRVILPALGVIGAGGAFLAFFSRDITALHTFKMWLDQFFGSGYWPWVPVMIWLAGTIISDIRARKPKK